MSKPREKVMTIDQVVAQLSDGMTIGIGGWGPRRKPMALVRAILRSDLKDLTIVSWGGADVGLLARAGKITKLVYAFVSLDSIPLEPNFQRARQNGTIPATELHRLGSVYRIAPRAELDAVALEVASSIAEKDGRVIRAAKEALNGIEPVDVNKSYRFEQGFTYELNLMGVSDELRDDFAGTEKSKK